jgi:transposase InsO family protein
VLLVSERRACRALSFPRSSQRYVRKIADHEQRLIERIVELGSEYGRYGYRRITALLHIEGWRVNHKKVERIWRQEGLKVPQKQPKRGRLWLNDGSTVRLRPEYENHVWSYDFVADRTRDGRAIRILNIIDEYSRKCLASIAERKITASDVIGHLADLFLRHGLPEHIRSDNGPEFTAKSVMRWLERLGARTLFIEPGSPWENGYIESFNGKMRDELLNGEIFDTLLEAKILIERWRIHYNEMRPHSSLGYRPPAPEAVLTTPLETPLLLPEQARGPT